MKRQLKFESPTCRKPRYASQLVDSVPAMRVLIIAVLMVGTLIATSARASEQPPRWIKADDLRVRAGPGLDKPVIGVLQRGTQVILKTTDSLGGYCQIEGGGQFGYVACQYLSAQPVARPQPGPGDMPTDLRWITGEEVNMRTAPVRDAQVLKRLSVNSMVRLLKDSAGAGFCEVQPLHSRSRADGPSGFTACQYLGIEPLCVAISCGQDRCQVTPSRLTAALPPGLEIRAISNGTRIAAKGDAWRPDWCPEVARLPKVLSADQVSIFGLLHVAGKLQAKGILRFEPNDGGELDFRPDKNTFQGTGKLFKENFDRVKLDIAEPSVKITPPQSLAKADCWQANATVELTDFDITPTSTSSKDGTYARQARVTKVTRFTKCIWGGP